MKKVLLGVVGLIFPAVIFAQMDANYNGYNDTAIIATFRADSLKYSKTFYLSKWENLRVTAYANDTGTAGYAGDSIAFVWGIQTGHPAYSTVSIASPKVCWGEEIVIDTFNITVAANMVRARPVLQNDGTYANQMKFIDTTRTSIAMAYQTRKISPDWDVYYRYWVKGLTGNRPAGSFVKLVFESNQRNYVPVRSR